jgi:menaquinone-dependent protoporphyrinogen oxidase
MNHREIAIVYSSKRGQTQKIASRIADRLRSAGLSANLYESAHPPSREALQRLGGIVVGSWVRGGRHLPAVRRFVRRNRDALARLPSAFFSVSLRQLSNREAAQRSAADYLPRFLREAGWHPRRSAVFAGALPFTRFGWLGKRIMRAIWRREGFEADITRDTEYTDWSQVERFAEDFGRLVAREAQLQSA